MLGGWSCCCRKALAGPDTICVKILFLVIVGGGMGKLEKSALRMGVSWLRSVSIWVSSMN